VASWLSSFIMADLEASTPRPSRPQDFDEVAVDHPPPVARDRGLFRGEGGGVSIITCRAASESVAPQGRWRPICPMLMRRPLREGGYPATRLGLVTRLCQGIRRNVPEDICKPVRRLAITGGGMVPTRGRSGQKGRPIDDDHYGVRHRVSACWPVPAIPVFERLFEAYRNRALGRDPQKGISAITRRRRRRSSIGSPPLSLSVSPNSFCAAASRVDEDCFAQTGG